VTTLPFRLQDSVELLDICIPGKPQGAARHRTRALVNAAGQYVGSMQHKEKKHARWESIAVDLFANAWSGMAPLDEPLVVEIDTVKYRSKEQMKAKKYGYDRLPCGVKPDADNVAKIVLDAMKSAGLMVDDCRVVDLRVRKWLCALDLAGNVAEPEHVEVVLKRWVQPHARTARGA
jgi:Holliday junction resolvase RusA-like endonuclease